MPRKTEDLTGKVFGRLTAVEKVVGENGRTMWKCICECGGETTAYATNLKRELSTSCGCGRRDDLTGKVFGKLTAVECLGANEQGYVVWRCTCECGGETVTRTASLKNGTTKSCGCIISNPREDLTGQVFGKLTVIEYAGLDDIKKHTMWKCKCECGNETITRKTRLKSGDTKSCGCALGNIQYKHGLYKHPIHKIWDGMKYRCNNPNATHYKHYGGRGIKVCDKWNNDFEAFYRDMIDTYKEGLTIERKDVNGDYSPENCVWATMEEQSHNRRNTRYMTVFGEKMSIAQAAKKYNINYGTLHGRLERGISDEDAVTLPIRNIGQEKRK